MSFGKFTVIVGCIRQVIEGWPGVSYYHTRIDYAGEDDGGEFISRARTSLVPWLGMAVNETWAALADGDHCREIAGKLRELARVTRLAGMRRELVDLAKRYDRRGDDFDRRGHR